MRSLGPITITGIWDRPKRPFEPGDLVDIKLVGVPKGGPAPSPGDRLPESSCVATTIRARVTAVESMKDEEGNDALQVTIEPLKEEKP